MEASTHHNHVDLEIQFSSSIVSFSLRTMTSLLQHNTTDDLDWNEQVAKCLSRKNGNISSFASSGTDRVTSSCIHLLYKMSCNASKVITSKKTEHETALNYNDIVTNKNSSKRSNRRLSVVPF